MPMWWMLVCLILLGLRGLLVTGLRMQMSSSSTGIAEKVVNAIMASPLYTPIGIMKFAICRHLERQ